MEKQINCLDEKVITFEQEMNQASDEKLNGEEGDTEEVNKSVEEINVKIAKFITVKERLAEIKTACDVIEKTTDPTVDPNNPTGGLVEEVQVVVNQLN